MGVTLRDSKDLQDRLLLLLHHAVRRKSHLRTEIK